MGIGPWAQGELRRATQQAERARFRRAVNLEIGRLDENPGQGMTYDEIYAMLQRLRERCAPHKRRAMGSHTKLFNPAEDQDR